METATAQYDILGTLHIDTHAPRALEVDMLHLDIFHPFQRQHRFGQQRQRQFFDLLGRIQPKSHVRIVDVILARHIHLFEQVHYIPAIVIGAGDQAVHHRFVEFNGLIGRIDLGYTHHVVGIAPCEITRNPFRIPALPLRRPVAEIPECTAPIIHFTVTRDRAGLNDFLHQGHRIVGPSGKFLDLIVHKHFGPRRDCRARKTGIPQLAERSDSRLAQIHFDDFTTHLGTDAAFRSGSLFDILRRNLHPSVKNHFRAVQRTHNQTAGGQPQLPGCHLQRFVKPISTSSHKQRYIVAFLLVLPGQHNSLLQRRGNYGALRCLGPVTGYTYHPVGRPNATADPAAEKKSQQSHHHCQFQVLQTKIHQFLKPPPYPLQKTPSKPSGRTGNSHHPSVSKIDSERDGIGHKNLF